MQRPAEPGAEAVPHDPATVLAVCLLFVSEPCGWTILIPWQPANCWLLSSRMWIRSRRVDSAVPALLQCQTCFQGYKYQAV